MLILFPVGPLWWSEGISDADDDVTNMAAEENGDSAGWTSADSTSGGSRLVSAYMLSRWCQNCCCCCCWWWCGGSSQCGATRRAPAKRTPISLNTRPISQCATRRSAIAEKRAMRPGRNPDPDWVRVRRAWIQDTDSDTDSRTRNHTPATTWIWIRTGTATRTAIRTASLGLRAYYQRTATKHFPPISPFVPPWSLNRVPASVGVRRECHRCRVAGNTVWSHMACEFP